MGNTKKAATKQKSRILFITTDASGEARIYSSLEKATNGLEQDDFTYMALFEVEVKTSYDMATPQPQIISANVDESIDWLELE